MKDCPYCGSRPLGHRQLTRVTVQQWSCGTWEDEYGWNEASMYCRSTACRLKVAEARIASLEAELQACQNAGRQHA